MKGFVSSTTQSVIDENGFERVRTQTKQFVYKTEEDSFYNVFLDYVHWMYNIRSAITLKVLLWMLENAEFNSGKVMLTIGARAELREFLDISAQALSRALQELLCNGAISRCYTVDKKTGEQKERKGEYIINPQMFWKGELKTRRKLIVEFKAVYEDEVQPILYQPDMQADN